MRIKDTTGRPVRLSAAAGAETSMALIEDLVAAIGEANVLTGPAAAEATFAPWTRVGTPLALCRPGSTEEVAAVLRLAHAAGTPVVPLGGLTGLVEGVGADDSIALSLRRMSEIEDIDVEGSVMRVQAGCVLETACAAADAAGLFLPLDLGSRGSATIGGVMSTNAGGNRVIRYGMTRDMVLGVEAVLADGTIVSSLNRLIKNNAGYDLKQLFIGSEGTLGVITRAVLRLRPKAASQQTAWLGVETFEALPKVLRRIESGLAGALSAFEVMWPAYYDLVTTPPAVGRPVLEGRHAYYVLVESLGSDPDADADRFETLLGDLLSDGLVADAAIAKSQAERDRMWALRDDVRQTGRNAPTVTFDISLPINRMESYVAGVEAALKARWPAATLVVLGHLGDGNLHLIIGVGDAGARHDIELICYEPLQAFGGSISAEHGIGRQKLAYLTYSRSEGEIALMRTLKAALDPNSILNPGKIFSPA